MEERLTKNKFRQELIGNFTSSFLSNSRQFPIDGLELYLNSWNNMLLSDLKLPDINIRNSAIGAALIYNVDFNHASISDSAFSNSSIINTIFSESTINATLFNNVPSLKGTQFRNTRFKDVFFTFTDVAGADFTGATGLEPINFFKANNLKQAIFDKNFKAQLEKAMETIKEDDFKSRVNNSTLTQLRMDELLADLTLRP